MHHYFMSCYISFAVCLHMMQPQANNPLHGKTLETIQNELVTFYGWPELGYRIRIN